MHPLIQLVAPGWVDYWNQQQWSIGREREWVSWDDILGWVGTVVGCQRLKRVPRSCQRFLWETGSKFMPSLVAISLPNMFMPANIIDCSDWSGLLLEQKHCLWGTCALLACWKLWHISIHPKSQVIWIWFPCFSMKPLKDKVHGILCIIFAIARFDKCQLLTSFFLPLIPLDL